MKTPRPVLLALPAALVFLAATLFANPPADPRHAYRRPATVPVPADNQLTPERVELGKKLFFDPRLSGSNVMSCASCHNPSFSWGDRQPVGTGHGHKKLGRRTPTILNAAFNELQMWDGRFATLEEQAIGPMTSPDEMNITAEEMIGRIRDNPGYRAYFRTAYGEAGVTVDTVTKAIAAFERTVISGEAPFDRFVAGDDQAISPAARRGFGLFNTKANCAACHSGWAFTDSSFHDIGVASDDPGRGRTLGIPELNHAFKTPTLRNIVERAPYMHDGSENTLHEVVELYNAGGRVKRSTLSSEIRPLGLTPQEVDDLVEFMRSLSSKDAPVTLPELP
jgi:cytochrome c peroxidase